MKMRFRERETGRLLEIPVETVRGIHFDPSHECYTVYFNEKTTDSRLLRETNLVPEPADETLRYIVTGAPTPVHVGEIVRYASAWK